LHFAVPDGYGAAASAAADDNDRSAAAAHDDHHHRAPALEHGYDGDGWGRMKCKMQNAKCKRDSNEEVRVKN
jgi:hypothetical protein